MNSHDAKKMTQLVGRQLMNEEVMSILHHVRRDAVLGIEQVFNAKHYVTN